jgi:hypothetical protein
MCIGKDSVVLLKKYGKFLYLMVKLKIKFVRDALARISGRSHGEIYFMPLTAANLLPTAHNAQSYLHKLKRSPLLESHGTLEYARSTTASMECRQQFRL